MSKDTHLFVSEAFYSIQGEGITQGKPSYFIRLSGCNLECGSTQENISKARKENWSQEKVIENIMPTASWVCDSIAVWLHGTKMSFDEVIKHLGDKIFIDNISNDANIIFTGGEPLLHQQAIINFVNYIEQQYKIKPTVEIETNGTILPSKEFADIVTLWNVSPKLSNSGMSYERRINNVALQFFADVNVFSIFKFVVKTHEDFLEIINEYIGPHNLPTEKIYLMPAADNRQDLIEVSRAIAEICLCYNFKFSNRLHLMIWDQKTGV